jgi:endonuclease/exonuclease/phosphatase family metal-dependent hydrolase
LLGSQENKENHERVIVDLTNDEDSDHDTKRPAKRSPQTKNPRRERTKTTATDSQKSSPAHQNSSLTVATYNIWFGTTGHEDRRMQALVQQLQQPHVIGLQEVTYPLQSLLQPILAKDYTWLQQPFSRYGCGLAVRRDVTILSHGFEPYSNSIMDRGMLWARMELPGKEVLFVTTHLESWAGTTYTGAQEREVQLHQVTQFCEQQLRLHSSIQVAVVTGDLNWDDERKAGQNRKLSSLISSQWMDAYRQIQPTAPGFTYDPQTNPMLGGGKRVQRRFDRILVLSGNNKVTVQSVELVGKDAIPGITYQTRPTHYRPSQTRPVAPSDHFGLVATLELDSSHS